MIESKPRRVVAPLLGLLLAAAAIGCEPPPDGDEVGPPLATIQLPTVVMYDTLLFTFVQVFQVHIYEGENTTGSVVSCDDFPARYTNNTDPRLRRVGTAINIENKWKQPPTAAVLNPIQVPAEKKLVFVIVGLAQTPKGPASVARGCKDALIFKEGSHNPLSIDVKATTGASCDQQNECELTLICRSGSTLPGGYCARVPCTGDASCPPGSRCVSDTAAGTTMCARSCANHKDCETSFPQAQVCEGRQGPTTGGCAEVCVHPFWNKTNLCNP